MSETRTNDKSEMAPGRYSGLPIGIWAMGFASMFMDISSELIHSLLPAFMVTTLHASMTTVGVIEGVAEATASIMKVFSGALSDFLKKRKILMIFGYALAALTKPIFPLANAIEWVFAARFLDRVGKGIRGAPRDALIADITQPAQRGAAYGLRQALDSLGALLGPLLATAMMIHFADNIRTAMWIAVVPAVLCVILLVVWVHEPDRSEEKQSQKRIKFSDMRRLPLSYWMVVLCGVVMTLARFSEAFLVLRAQDLGLAIAYVPLVMVVMNIFYSGAAYPAGIAADKFSRRSLLLLGIVFLIGADMVLGFAETIPAVFIGVILWGFHMAFTQGLLSKLVADTSPAELVGTGFGIFNLMSGLALLAASAIAGYLWKSVGPSATFFAGAGFAAAAAIGLALTVRESKTEKSALA